MRGRLIHAVLALAAFLASYGAPLQPLFPRAMSCCPSGKSAACCKRNHAQGWVANTSSCGGTCACAFPSSASPAIVADHGGFAGPAHSLEPARSQADAPAPTFYQAFLYQRPPPVTV